MSRSRLPALLTSLGVLLLLGTAPASAQTAVAVDDLVEQLRSEQVVLADDADVPLDVSAAREAVRSADVPIYVAGVSEATASRAGGDAALTTTLGQGLSESNAVVLLITDRPSVYAENGDEAERRGVRAEAALDAVNTSRTFDEASVSALVRGFASEVDGQLAGTTGTPSRNSGGGSGLLAVLGLGALGFGGYAVLRSRRTARSRATELEDLRADVESLYGRLGSDVQLLAPGDDAVARQALADASERYTATGALLAKADTPGEYAAARRTAVEGITAARVVRDRLGLDPGPDVPMPQGQGPQLQEAARVQVGEEEYDGSPRYEPGRPHYYEGGYYGGQAIPGGWYATPFWQTLLMGGMMSGGLGGGYGGYGGRGYGRRGGFGGGSGGIAGGVFGGGLGGGLRGGLGGGLGGRRRGGGWSGRSGGGGNWGSGGGRRRSGGGGW